VRNLRMVAGNNLPPAVIHIKEMLRRWETKYTFRSQSVHDQTASRFDQGSLSRVVWTAARDAQPHMLTFCCHEQEFFMVICSVLLSMTVELSHWFTLTTARIRRSLALSRRTTATAPDTTDPAHVLDRADIPDETGLAETLPARPVCVRQGR
jgi:hypothetical protein